MPTTLASKFHDLAAGFLSSQGFHLINNPGEMVGRFGGSLAAYESDSGLCLDVSFEPGDSNSASIRFGRSWSFDGGQICLSNYFAVLAHRLGFDFPPTYTLGYGDEAKKTLRTILYDLATTLPLVLEKLTLPDLLEVEKLTYGAHRRAYHQIGKDYLEKVQISDFKGL